MMNIPRSLERETDDSHVTRGLSLVVDDVERRETTDYCLPNVATVLFASSRLRAASTTLKTLTP
jgi:hypothetical protein